MLLEFKVKNYKIFRDEAVFSMHKAEEETGLSYSILKKNQSKDTVVEGLCSSVIYGPNASGKTNLIGAMDTFRAIVLRGDINNGETVQLENPARSMLDLIPNKKLESPEPIEFSVEFFYGKKLVKYVLQFVVGTFMCSEPSRHITKEELYVQHTRIFTREEKISWGEKKDIGTHFTIKKFTLDQIMEIAEESLEKTDLFLTNGFKLFFSPALVNSITEWFKEKLQVVCSSNLLETKPRLPISVNEDLYADNLINKAAQCFGVYSNELIFLKNEDKFKLCSVFPGDNTSDKGALLAEFFESLGTIRFLSLFPLIYKALAEGHTLILDEFDASLHPMAIMNLVNIFHNDEINVQGAQLIFNTHNPIFLNRNLFRSDEIKFVERDSETHSSEVYALSDFDDEETKRSDDPSIYMKNYFVSRYGAIEHVDFSSLFEDIIEKNQDEDVK